MTDESVECFNCGRANPEWAQVCRSCGVVLRHGETRVQPAERIPRDRDSLISIAAVIGTIMLALVLGLFISSLNPTDPSVGLSSPSPTAPLEPSVEPSVEPIATETPVPTATPVPLPGTVTFGTTIADGQVTDPTTAFTPGMSFAYSVSMPNTFGAPQIQNEIARIAEDGTEEIVLERQAVDVSPDATVFGYVIGPAEAFIGELGGPGDYVWRIYVNDQVVAQSQFNYAEG